MLETNSNAQGEKPEGHVEDNKQDDYEGKEVEGDDSDFHFSDDDDEKEDNHKSKKLDVNKYHLIVF